MTFDRLDAIVKARSKAGWNADLHGPICQDSPDEESGFCSFGPIHSEMDEQDSWDAAMLAAEQDARFIATMGTLADLMMDCIKAAEAFLYAPIDADFQEFVALEGSLSALRTACEALP